MLQPLLQKIMIAGFGVLLLAGCQRVDFWRVGKSNESSSKILITLAQGSGEALTEKKVVCRNGDLYSLAGANYLRLVSLDVDELQTLKQILGGQSINFTQQTPIKQVELKYFGATSNTRQLTWDEYHDLADQINIVFNTRERYFGVQAVKPHQPWPAYDWPDSDKIDLAKFEANTVSLAELSAEQRQVFFDVQKKFNAPEVIFAQGYDFYRVNLDSLEQGYVFVSRFQEVHDLAEAAAGLGLTSEQLQALPVNPAEKILVRFDQVQNQKLLDQLSVAENQFKRIHGYYLQNNQKKIQALNLSLVFETAAEEDLCVGGGDRD